MQSEKLKQLVPSALILGLLYCILIFVQNQYLYKSPIMFSGAKFVCYIIIMVGMLIMGFKFRKDQGGYIGFKDALQAFLVIVVVIEIMYTLFGVIYNLAIEPEFVNKLKVAWLQYADNLPIPEEQREEMKDRMLQPFESGDAGKVTVKNVLSGFGFSLLIDGIVAILFSAIIKKNKPVFEHE